MKKKCIIIDIDGTLANVEHRRKDLLNNNNWTVFNSKVDLDKVNLWCREIVDAFKEKYHIILLTGRSEELCKATLNWLKDNNIFYSEIFFRKEGDYRDDVIIKKEIYKHCIESAYFPLFIVDDRSKVVKMWRELGLVCLQCDYGEF